MTIAPVNLDARINYPAPSSKAAHDCESGIGLCDRNLDLLRAFAVLCVVATHCIQVWWPKLPAAGAPGRFAVLIFFVHTALVLMLSMQRQGASRLATAHFYVQRFFRIYPLAILCVLVFLLCRIPWVPVAVFAWPGAAEILRNLTLTQNLAAGHPVSAPLWTLPYEVQMYLLLPWTWRFVRRYSTEGAWLLVCVAIVITIVERASASSSVWVTGFFPCFMGGVLAFSTYTRRPILPGFLWPVTIGAFGAVAIGTAMPPIHEWFLCLLLGFAIPFFGPISKGRLAQASALIARYSYAIYLSHQPLLWLCFKHLSAPRGVQWFAFAITASLLPVLLYHAVEAPMIRLGKRLTGPQHQFLRGV